MPQYELNINDYIRILRKRRFIIIFCFIAMLVTSLFFVSQESPQYKAVSSVKIEQRQTVAGLLTELVTYSPGDVMESAAKIIKGYPVMRKVARRLGLTEKGTPKTKARAIIAELQGDVIAEPVKSTNIIEITVTSGNAKKAMDLANAVADVYIEENLLEKNKQATTARKFIEEQLNTLENKLNQTEESLMSFGDEVKGIRVSPSLQTKLTELEFSLLDLKQKYTDKHPLVKQIQDQISDLESQLKGFSGQELEYARLARDVEVNRKLHALLREKLEEARITEAQKVSDVSIVNPAILPAVSVGQDRKTGVVLGGLTGLVLGIILAFVLESLDTSIGTIEDVESLLKLPVLGVVPSVKFESEKKANIFQEMLSFFAARKQSKAENTYARLIVHHEPKSFIAEAYRSIRTNLKLSSSLKTILITSANPQEGKTTVLTNLSLVIAQGGSKTLVVSTDLRRPVIARTFGLKEEPGLNEVLTKVVTLDSAIRSMSDIMLGDMKLDNIMETPGMENISILPSGRIPMNPSELLESGQMHSLISELRSRFDVAVFDSPPVLPITDAVLLASKVDGVVLVYEAGRTARSALLRAKAQLESAGAKILGVVLNHIKPETEAAVNYPHYGRYKYYGEEEDKAGKKKPFKK